MDRAYESFPLHFILKHGRKHLENVCLEIFFSNEYEDRIDPEKIDLYLSDLIYELECMDVNSDPYPYIINKYPQISSLMEIENIPNFNTAKKESIDILANAQKYIASDLALIDYARQSINAALAVEFYGQIQPAALPQIKSYIEMNHQGETCFKILMNQLIGNPINIQRLMFPM